MSELVLVGLVLASALLHALWNAMLRRHPQRDVVGVWVVIVAALTSTVVAVARVLGGGPVPWANSTAFVASLVAGVFEGGYFAALIVALGRAPLGLAYTVSRGGAIALVWPISIVFLGELATLGAILGSGAVLAGLAASGLGSLDANERRGLAPALLAAVCIAGYHLAYKVAMGAGGEPAAVFALSLGVAVPVNLAKLHWDGRLGALSESFVARPAWILAAGIVCGGSFLLFMTALNVGGAGFVLTLRNTSIVFAALMSLAIGEPPSRRQWLGALLVTAGALLLGRR